MIKIFAFICVLSTLTLSHATENMTKIDELYESYHKSSLNKSSETDLLLFSKELREYAEEFHQEIISDLDAETPLFGRQLTNLHKLVSLYGDIEDDLLAKNKGDTSLEAYLNFKEVYFPFYYHNRLRRYLNDEDLSFGVERHELYNKIMSLISWSTRERVKTQLSSNLKSHQAYDFFMADQSMTELSRLYEQYHRSDLVNDGFVDLTDDLSGWFGNFVGAIRWREGYLHHDYALNAEIEGLLEPLDIITEKTYFALTDKLIPGHFGHNALWLGTEAQLRELGMWDHPSLSAYQTEIRAGKSILEVDRSGTHLKSLEDFMNVDEFAIIRLKDREFIHKSKSLLTRDLEMVYEVALSQMGKVYDFNFDVETTDRLVCSELLYQSFGHIHWPTEDLLGRITISPDNVASLALYTDSPVELLYYVAEAKQGRREYKNLSDLASDIEVMERDGVFYTNVSECSQTRRGRRCQQKLKELIYQAHDLPADLPSNIASY